MEHGRTLSDALRHRGLLLLAIVAAFLLGGGVFTGITPPVYEATARLSIDAGETESAQLSREQLGRYIIQLARSRPVLARMIADLRWTRTSPDNLAKKVRAEVVRGTGVVALHAEADSGPHAAALANLLARVIVERNKAEAAERFRPNREHLDAEQARLDAMIQQVRNEVIAPTDVNGLANHQARLSQLQAQYDGNYARRQDLAATQLRAEQVVRIMEFAVTPGKPSRPDPIRYLLATLAVGLSVGLITILLVERFDDRLLSAEELARATGTPLVVSMPHFSNKGLADRQLVPYQVAHANLLARRPGLRTVMVAAASTRDRSDDVADRLAAVAADSGQRVLVVQTDNLAGRLPKPVSQNGSRVTTVPAGASEDKRVATEALEQLADRYDFAVVSVGSPNTNPSAFSLARSTDLAVVVATSGVTPFGEARRTAESLRQAGVDLVASFLLADREDAQRRP